MKTKLLLKVGLFALANGAILATVLLGTPSVILTTLIALGVVGFEYSLFLLLFTNSNQSKT